jgi:uncharacterized protein (DUF433 family)
MAISISEVAIPLKVDTSGVVRVGGTRVTLDTVVMAFKEGATAEEIMQQYPSLRLADIYFTIGYYLEQREEVEEYLRQREERADEVRKRYGTTVDLQELRERLSKRHSKESK